MDPSDMARSTTPNAISLVPAAVEIRFSPNVELISHVRRFASQFYTHVLGDADVADRIALATHELLENAARYSSDNETKTLLQVTAEPHATVSVRTWNRASPEQRAILRGIFDDLARYGSAFDYYQDAMRRTANRTDGSRLGLARVWAEANMALSFSEEGDWVVIHAELKINSEPSS